MQIKRILFRKSDKMADWSESDYFCSDICLTHRVADITFFAQVCYITMEIPYINHWYEWNFLSLTSIVYKGSIHDISQIFDTSNGYYILHIPIVYMVIFPTEMVTQRLHFWTFGTVKNSTPPTRCSLFQNKDAWKENTLKPNPSV